MYLLYINVFTIYKILHKIDIKKFFNSFCTLIYYVKFTNTILYKKNL